MAVRDLIVIGASAGGIQALTGLFGALRGDLPAAVLLVQHTAPTGPQTLPTALADRGPLPARFAEAGEFPEPGVLYVAPPDRHLVLSGSKMHLTDGPRENRSRPSVDVLFRTAAVDAGSRVVGVLLSGMLDDGATGLHAIKRVGGSAVVQDPEDALYDEMPRNAMRSVEPDHVLPAGAIGRLLNRLAGEPVEDGPEPPPSMQAEAAISANGRSTIGDVERLGGSAGVTCPDCGGPLWRIDDAPVPRYRCHTGHSFGEPSLLDGMGEATERALYSALRVMDERTRMLDRLAESAERRGQASTAAGWRTRTNESRSEAETLRELLARSVPRGRIGGRAG